MAKDNIIDSSNQYYDSERSKKVGIGSNIMCLFFYVCTYFIDRKSQAGIFL